MFFLSVAGLIATAHLSFIVFLVIGGEVGRRWEGARKWHLGALAITVAINLSNSPCPLTVWEKDLIEAGGRQPYNNGFISHYLVEPIHPAGVDGTVNLILLALIAVPAVLAYARLGGGRSSRGAAFDET